MCSRKSKACCYVECLIRYVPNTGTFPCKGFEKLLMLYSQYCLVSTGSYSGAVTVLSVMLYHCTPKNVILGTCL